jgi:hypothetical protein
MRKANEIQYFLVGATWGNHDNTNDFTKNGIWKSGFDIKTDKNISVIEKMSPGDRIAIKRGLGGRNPNISIRAIGIVKGIDLTESKAIVYVDWILPKIKNRTVKSKGCYGTSHGPYLKSKNNDRDWINEAFSL